MWVPSKRTLFRIHGWIGVRLGVLFFIVCFSGTLATLSSEMDWLVNSAIRATPQTTLASKNTIVANLQQALPGSTPEFWLSAREPYLCDIIYLVLPNGNRTYAFANPYTGIIQGTANLTIQRYLRDLHYYLFVPFQIGHFAVLTFSFLLFFSLLTALLFYKKWYRKLFELKRGKVKLVLFRSLHRVAGLWTIPFLLLFSITGIWYFLERTDTAAISTTANPPSPTLALPLLDSVDLINLPWRLDYDRAADSARAHIPGLAIREISFPDRSDAPLYLTGQGDVPLVRNRANRVYLHPQTYAVIGLQRADDLPLVTWLNDIADPLHFGNFGGLPTKIVWFLAGLAICGLILTGLYIFTKRNLTRKPDRSTDNWMYLNGLVVVVLLGFMFYTLVERYRAPWPVLLFIGGAWSLMALAGWYVFVYRMKCRLPCVGSNRLQKASRG